MTTRPTGPEPNNFSIHTNPRPTVNCFSQPAEGELVQSVSVSSSNNPPPVVDLSSSSFHLSGPNTCNSSNSNNPNSNVVHPLPTSSETLGLKKDRVGESRSLDLSGEETILTREEAFSDKTGPQENFKPSVRKPFAESLKLESKEKKSGNSPPHALIYNSTHPLQIIPPNMSKVVCRVIIPTAFAGNIFGKGGTVLNDMRDTFNAKISIPNSDGPERNVYVESATAKDVASCTVALAIRIQDDMQKINKALGKDDIELRMLLHTSQAGHVIGHKGDNITALRKETNCKIKLHSFKCPMSTDRICQLSGSVANVTLCLDKILADLKTTPLEGNVIQYDANMFNEREEYGGFRSWIIENATGKTWRGNRTNPDDRYNGDRSRNPYNDNYRGYNQNWNHRGDYRNNDNNNNNYSDKPYQGYNSNYNNGGNNFRSNDDRNKEFGTFRSGTNDNFYNNRNNQGGAGSGNDRGGFNNNRGGAGGDLGGYNSNNNIGGGGSGGFGRNNNFQSGGGPAGNMQNGGGNGGNNGPRSDFNLGNRANYDDPSEEDKVVCRLLIPTRLAGALIGKRGETVNRMRMEYSCEISIPTSTSSERTLRVMSTEHKNVVNCMKAMLDEIGEDLKRAGRIIEDGQTEVRLLMHTSHAGYVIGQGGKNIKSLRTDTGCRIIINTDHCPYSTDRVCQISGTAEEVINCVDRVLIMIDETPIKGEKKRYNANFANDKIDYGGYKSGPRRSDRRFGSGDNRDASNNDAGQGNNGGFSSKDNENKSGGHGQYNGGQAYNNRDDDYNKGAGHKYNDNNRSNDRYEPRGGYGNNWENQNDNNNNNAFRPNNFNNNSSGRYGNNNNTTSNSGYNSYNNNNNSGGAGAFNNNNSTGQSGGQASNNHNGNNNTSNANTHTRNPGTGGGYKPQNSTNHVPQNGSIPGTGGSNYGGAGGAGGKSDYNKPPRNGAGDKFIPGNRDASGVKKENE